MASVVKKSKLCLSFPTLFSLHSFKDHAFPWLPLHSAHRTVNHCHIFASWWKPKNQCVLVRVCSNSSIIFECSVLLEFSSGLLFLLMWHHDLVCIFRIYVFLPFLFLHLAGIWCVHCALCKSLPSSATISCVCLVCVCMHRDTQVRDSWKKQKQSRFSFYANLNDCPSLDKVWHIPWCFIYNLAIMQIPDPASRGLWYVSLFH